MFFSFIVPPLTEVLVTNKMYPTAMISLESSSDRYIYLNIENKK